MGRGPCRASKPRFHFDGVECVRFNYGGCGGNGNNFRTLKDCEKRCITEGSNENNESKEVNKH